MNNINERYILVYRFNDKEITEEFIKSNDAWTRRLHLIKDGYEPEDVSIHLKQLNKFGDSIIVEQEMN